MDFACGFIKPLPLNKNENTESNEANQILEVKAKDSEKLDSESKGVTRADSKIVDCHADKSARNDKERDSKSEYSHEATPACNNKRTQSQADSKIVDCHADTPAHNDEKTESRGRAESAMVGDSEKRWLGDSRRGGIL